MTLDVQDLGEMAPRREELEAGAPALPVEFMTSGWRGLGPLT